MKKDNAVDPLAKERDLRGKKVVRRRDAGKVVSAEALEPRNIKVHISIKLDADVLDYFKQRARRSGAPPYQTQINQALRQVIDRDREGFRAEALLRDDRLLDAIAEWVKQRL